MVMVSLADADQPLVAKHDEQHTRPRSGRHLRRTFGIVVGLVGTLVLVLVGTIMCHQERQSDAIYIESARNRGMLSLLKFQSANVSNR